MPHNACRVIDRVRVFTSLWSETTEERTMGMRAATVERNVGHSTINNRVIS